jgi:hypothetical protein
MSIAESPTQRPPKPRGRNSAAEAYGRMTGGHQKKEREATPWGIIASYHVELLELREEVRFLAGKVEHLERFVEPRDIAAYERLKLITPTAEEFADMGESGPPEAYPEDSSDRP